MLSLGQIASRATFTIFASLALLSSAALSQVDPSHRQKTGAVSAPGVYVEETPAPGKTIPGVSTRVPSLAGQSATISGPSEMPRWRPDTGTNDKDSSHGQRDAGPNAGDVAQGGGTKSSARVQHRGALQSPADAARMGDTQALNPQPIPPGRQQALNPQPIPPGTTPQIDPPPSTRQQSLQGHGSSNSSEFRTSNTRSSTEFEKQSRSMGKTSAQGESRSEFTGSRSSHEMMVRGGNDRLR